MFFVLVSARTAAKFVGFLIAAAVFIGIWHAVGRAIHGTSMAEKLAALRVGVTLTSVRREVGAPDSVSALPWGVYWDYGTLCELRFRHGRLASKWGCD